MISESSFNGKFKAGVSTPQEFARRLSCTRRDFLRGATGIALGSALSSASPFVRGATATKRRKVIVVTFGGGARDQETFAPEGQENIPHLLHELIPQSSFFTQVVNQGILGHYVATASLATGVYETINNFSAVPRNIPRYLSTFAKICGVRPQMPGLSRPATDLTGLVRVITALMVRVWVREWFYPSIC
jgi:hypothetical protein